jgi:hypothetical protein
MVGARGAHIFVNDCVIQKNKKYRLKKGKENLFSLQEGRSNQIALSLAMRKIPRTPGIPF